MTNKDMIGMREEQELISAGELADMAGVTLQSVHNYVQRGDIVPAERDSSGRPFFRKEQIVAVSFLKKGRSSMCNNILCLCFSDNQEELSNFEEKAVEFFKTYQAMKEEKSSGSRGDIFKDYSRKASVTGVVGIQRIDDFESAYREYREANENHITDNSDFQDEIDKMIKKEVLDRIASYEVKLLKSISRLNQKGLETPKWGDGSSNMLEVKKRALINTSETPEFRELFIQRKGNALLNKYLWKEFERDVLADSYYSLRSVLISDDRKEFTDILSLILRGEYKQVFILGYDSIPDVIKQVLQVLESLHRISVVKEF
jgi:DNA-binding transcriptional MerR regulator